MTLDEERVRGEHARRLMSDPMLVEAFDTVEKTIRDAWAGSGEQQERERERLWLMLKLLGRVQGHLKTALETGKLAATQLDIEERREERKRRHSTREI